MTKTFASEADLFLKTGSAGERARLWLAAKATPGMPTLFTRNELAKGWPAEAGAELEQALAALLKARQLWRIERGRLVFYLHAASVAPLLPAVAQAGKSPRPARRSVLATPQTTSALPVRTLVERVRTAYRELARLTGFSDVLISDLQKRAGVALAELQPWLVLESRAGRALPTRGDWSIADAEARAAAIEIGREPHLRVRLVDQESARN